jgi:hypothetical protein
MRHVVSKRRSRGFGPVGCVRLEGSGLRRQEARRLLLQHGWRRVAGDPVASRLSVQRVVRGTLEIEADPRWAASLAPVLESLVARLAARVPELGIRRYRLRTGEGAGEVDAIPVTPAPGAAADPAVPTPAAPSSPPAVEPELPLRERLDRVARRYLERAGRPPR